MVRRKERKGSEGRSPTQWSLKVGDYDLLCAASAAAAHTNITSVQNSRLRQLLLLLLVVVVRVMEMLMMMMMTELCLYGRLIRLIQWTELQIHVLYSFSYDSSCTTDRSNGVCAISCCCCCWWWWCVWWRCWWWYGKASCHQTPLTQSLSTSVLSARLLAPAPTVYGRSLTRHESATKR